MTNALAMQARKYKQLIDGEWVGAEGGRTYDDMNPCSGARRRFIRAIDYAAIIAGSLVAS